jgi:protein-L-isoaspartate O-methyltransferase
MTSWRDFVDSIDDSHPMTTAKKHIAMLCEAIEGQAWRILELGSHAGLSAAAMALAAPRSTITAVDLCDTVGEAWRTTYWATLGITNIKPVSGSAGDFVSTCLPGQFDFIFHDAVHGPAAFFEYLGCAEIASGLAIHDFEQLPPEMQAAVTAKFAHTKTDADHKGRVLFLGWK